MVRQQRRAACGRQLAPVSRLAGADVAVDAELDADRLDGTTELRALLSKCWLPECPHRHAAQERLDLLRDCVGEDPIVPDASGAGAVCHDLPLEPAEELPLRWV